MANFVNLENRELVFVNGKDHVSFLQGLVTNDIAKIGDGELGYALMLNPQGRFLHEFFICKYEDGLLLEVAAGSNADNLVRKLTFYKLRADVEIKKLADFGVFFIDDVDSDIGLRDPRVDGFGRRFYGDKKALDGLSEKDLGFYHHLRFQKIIVDENDLTFDKSLIAEFGFDGFNAISYEKGCYVGQETVARAHYKGQIRKKVFLVEIKNLLEVSKDSEITCDEKKQGVVLSSLFYENKLQALALIKNLDTSGNEIDVSGLNLEIDGNKLKIIK